MISIKLTYSDGDTDSFIFNKSSITIGRSSDNDLTIIPASGVSRHHSKLLVEADQLVVEDLNSTNGTFLNSIKVNRSIVGIDDTIKIGDAILKVTFREENSLLASMSPSDLPDEALVDNSKIEELLPEAVNKISESSVTKVIILPNKKVKVIENDNEIELDLVYSQRVLTKISQYYHVYGDVNTLKLNDSVNCTILNLGLGQTYIYLERLNFSNKATCKKEGMDILSSAVAQGKNIIFAGSNKRAIQVLISEFISSYQFVALDKFKAFKLNDQSINFFISKREDLLIAGTFSTNILFNKYLIDNLEQYDFDALNSFISKFYLGGISYLEAQNMSETQIKIAKICSHDFWCDFLVWIDTENDVTSVKSIYQSGYSDGNEQLEFSTVYSSS